MRINFYDDPLGGPRPRDEVKFNELGLFVYDDRKRVAVGFDIVPFREPPSIFVVVTNKLGEEVASLSVINAVQPNFNLTMHLRDGHLDNAHLDDGHHLDDHSSNLYDIEAIIYYVSSEDDRMIVDRIKKSFDISQPGEQ